MDNITVAMVIQDYLPHVGGAEQQLASLAPLLKNKGVDLHIITRRYPGLKRFEQINGIPVYRTAVFPMKVITSMLYIGLGANAIRKIKPDIIHAHGLLSPTSTAIAAKQFTGTPVVSKSLRGGIKGDLMRLLNKPLGDRRIKSYQKNVDAFIVISNEIKKELIKAGVPGEKCCFIPNGVDIGKYRPVLDKQNLKKQLGLSAKEIVLFVGRLEPEKQVDKLIEIWPLVRNEHPEAELVILGTGSQYELLKKSSGPGMRFMGLIDDVLDYYRAADLFILPSVGEGLSNALLEAMAVGLPAIASRVGGTTDVITDGETGLLFTPNDSVALLEKILYLFGDKRLRNKIAKAGRKYVINNYSLSTTAEKLYRLYLSQIESSIINSPKLN
jgi:glycosyltransferase involved in cell wall biosynthesis